MKHLVKKEELGLLITQTSNIIERKINPKKEAKCSCCGSVYEKKNAVTLFTNYGGAQRKLCYCSNNCAEKVIELNPERISKKPLKPLNLWRTK